MLVESLIAAAVLVGNLTIGMVLDEELLPEELSFWSSFIGWRPIVKTALLLTLGCVVVGFAVVWLAQKQTESSWYLHGAGPALVIVAGSRLDKPWSGGGPAAGSQIRTLLDAALSRAMSYCTNQTREACERWALNLGPDQLVKRALQHPRSLGEGARKDLKRWVRHLGSTDKFEREIAHSQLVSYIVDQWMTGKRKMPNT